MRFRGESTSIVRARRTLASFAALTAIALAACSDDGGATATGSGGGDATSGTGGDTTAGTGGATAGTGGATAGTGGGLADPLFEGTFWVETHAFVGGEVRSASYGLLWDIGSAGGSIENWYDQFIGSAATLQPGECGLITQGAAPTYTPFTVGPTLFVRDASTDLIDLSLESSSDYYGEALATEAAALHAATFTLAIDPGTATVPALTSNPLGPLVDVVPPTNVTCDVTTPCTVTAPPSDPVDDFLVLFDLTYVCRGNPTTGEFTISTEALASDGDALAGLQVYAIKRQTASLGANQVDMQLVTRHEFQITLE